MERKRNRGDASAGRMNVLEKIAALIVKSRYIIFVLFAAAALFCILSVGKVKVNNELTSLLPPDSETRRGIVIMDEEFESYGSSKVMISGIAYDDAKNLSEKIKDIEHVSDVGFDDTPSHYKDSSALFTVSYDASNDNDGTQEAISKIASLVEPYESYTAGGSVYSKSLASEMGFVILLAAIVILAVLLFTSRSYFEIVIFAVVFVFAALLNMGTNYLVGTISTITNSVAVILQLALAIDYAIIFAHRYESESTYTSQPREALIRALSRSIVEISSSSLTTIAGLVALTLMQFRLGYDLGI
ncbi:MAG: MMPL family transporter, partial [Clostridia bacterium]|nr:MMPL family transporter [Clostridia bacterium]